MHHKSPRHEKVTRRSSPPKAHAVQQGPSSQFCEVGHPREERVLIAKEARATCLHASDIVAQATDGSCKRKLYEEPRREEDVSTLSMHSDTRIPTVVLMRTGNVEIIPAGDEFSWDGLPNY